MEEPTSPTAEQGQAAAVVAHVTRQFSGPLPPPEALAAYNDVDPTFAGRIMAEAEKEAAARRSMELMIVEAQVRDVAAQSRDLHAQRMEIRVGQCFAFGITLLWLPMTAYIIIRGHPVAGALLSGGTLASLVGAFLYRRQASQGTGGSLQAGELEFTADPTHPNPPTMATILRPSESSRRHDEA